LRRGRAIVEWLAAHAANAGARELCPPTFSAPDFFAACGFREFPREDVPAAVAATEKFANLCPASAVCLVREDAALGVLFDQQQGLGFERGADRDDQTPAGFELGEQRRRDQVRRGGHGYAVEGVELGSAEIAVGAAGLDIDEA